MAWVVDKSLDVLLAQINAAAPSRDKSSDGSIGDPAHAATVSAHNPQDTEDSSDGNDPDNQVDARDITHDPRFAGSDMAQVTEAIRMSKDRRVRLVIFNKRIFASYATATRPAWAWGPYIGQNDHSKHAHVETNDVHNDELQPWSIFLTVPSKGDNMLMLAVDTKTGQHWLCDGMTRRPIAAEDVKHIKYLGSTGALTVWTGKPAEAPNSIWLGVGDLMGLPVGSVDIDYDQLAESIIEALPEGLAIPTAQENADAVARELADRLDG